MNSESKGAIVVSNMSKSFKVFDHRSDRLRERLSFGRKSFHHPAEVLKNISLNIVPGESYGLIGMNSEE